MFIRDWDQSCPGHKSLSGCQAPGQLKKADKSLGLKGKNLLYSTHSHLCQETVLSGGTVGPFHYEDGFWRLRYTCLWGGEKAECGGGRSVGGCTCMREQFCAPLPNVCEIFKGGWKGLGRPNLRTPSTKILDAPPPPFIL